MNPVIAERATSSAVIVRLDRTIQYAVTSAFEPGRPVLLDAHFRWHDHDWVGNV
jgi:hypothetical protein